MKSVVYSLFILLISISVNAQVGIGETSPNGALDITSTNDGLLIPRVALTDLTTNTVLTPTESEIVFNTTSNGTVEPGFYYLADVAGTLTWVRFGGSGWLLDGNPSVTAASFMGSINNADVVFKRNNIESGRLSTNNTSFGTGALPANNVNAWNTAFGTDALGSITNGGRNVAIGHKALESATTQRFNVAIGYTALQDNRGEWNTAIGHEALKDISDGAAQYNVAIGHQSMDLATGVTNYNVAIGSGTLRSANGGTQNTVVGSNAGSTITSGDNNIAIGINAQVPSATASNQISIGNLIYGSLGNIGIGVTGPSTKLEVNGVVTANSYVSGTTTYPDYVFENYFNGMSIIKSDYKFNTLKNAEAFVVKNGHLPGVKSYAEVMENGFKLDITDATITNLEKLEEQFLYIVELNKKIDKQKNVILNQNEKIKALEERLERIEMLLSSKF
jgi:hypothetical protein